MPTKLLAEGFELAELNNLSLPVGRELELRLYTLKAPTVEALNELQQHLANSVELLAPIEATVETPSIWRIRFKVNPQGNIGFVQFILPILLLGLFGFLGWALMDTIKTIIWPLAIITAGIVAFLVIRKQSAKT